MTYELDELIEVNRQVVEDHGSEYDRQTVEALMELREARVRLAEADRANAELNVEVSRLYACRNELQDVTQAMDDPSVNNTRSIKDAIHTMKARLSEAERLIRRNGSSLTASATEEPR